MTQSRRPSTEPMGLREATSTVPAVENDAAVSGALSTQLRYSRFAPITGIIGALLLAGAVVFGWYLKAHPAYLGLDNRSDTLAFDRWAFGKITPLHSWRHYADFNYLAQLGNPLVGGVVLLVALERSRRRDFIGCVAVVVGTVLAVGAVEALKHWVQRHVGSGLSYPSGHVAGCAILFMGLISLTRGLARLTFVTLGAAASFGVMVAVVALGWHYPSDTVAGIAVGVGALLLANGVVRLRATVRAIAHIGVVERMLLHNVRRGHVAR